MSQPDTARLLIACDDQPGIVRRRRRRARSARGEHHLPRPALDGLRGRTLLQRTVIHLDGLSAARPALEADIAGVAERFGMEWSLHDVARRKRVAIFVSKYDHCLMELLWRTQRGQLDIDITMVVSNHPDLAEAVRSFGVPFVHIPSGDKAAMRSASWSCCAATSISSCSRATCRSSPTISSPGSRPR